MPTVLAIGGDLDSAKALTRVELPQRRQAHHSSRSVMFAEWAPGRSPRAILGG